MGQSILEFLKDESWVVLFVVGGLVVLILASLDLIAKTFQARSFEQSRREIAAYVAEGTIAPDDAARLLASGSGGRKDPGRKLAKALNWGTISKKDAQKLVDARSGVSDETWTEMVELVTDGMAADDAIKLAKSRSAPVPA